MNKKINIWLIFLILLLSSIPLNSITNNNTAIADSSIYENEYGRLEVYPSTSRGITRQKQYWNLSSYYTGCIDVAFAFDNPLSYGGIYRWNGNEYVKMTTNYVEYNDDAYYILNDLNVIDGGEYHGYWEYDTPVGSNGKWDMYVKRCTDTWDEYRIHLDPWWDSDWDNYVAYYINSNLIDNILFSFPVMIKINDTIGDQCQANGEDIRFLSTDNKTEYPYEIERWEDGFDRICWVNVTTVEANINTPILVYYNNSGATDNQSADTVWDSNYLAVYHMNESAGSTVFDMSGSGNTATYNGSLPTRVSWNDTIGYAQNFDGDGDYIDLPAGVHVDTAGTIMCWFEPGSFNTRHYIYCDDDGATSEYINMNCYEKPSNDVQSVGNMGGSAQWIESGQPYHLVDQVFTLAWQTNDMVLYVNSSLVDNDNTVVGDAFIPGAGSNHSIGTFKSESQWANGTIDEYRISNIRRSDAYIKATSYNLINYSSFFIIGAEVQQSGITQPGDFRVNTTGCTTMNITWTMGTNATHTSIYRKTGSYPSTRGDGTNVYNDTGTAFDDTSLDVENVYYYRAWSYNSTLNSWGDSYAEAYNYTSPSNPTGVSTYVNSTGVNISWTKDTIASYTLVVYKNGSYPTSETDGTVLYNNTGTYYDDTSFDTSRYYTLFSYNSNITCYSSGVNAPWGALDINVYNENTSEAITNWYVFISNNDKTTTYESLNNNNTLTIDIDDIPYGTNTMIVINATNFDTKIYYMDLSINTHYTLSAYLSESNDTESYILRVINEYDDGVGGATVYVMRYINDTVGYENLSILLSDGTGYCPAVNLIPDEQYAARIEADGYITAVYDFFPIPIEYIEDRYFTFTILFIEEEYVNESNYAENITFTAEIGGNTLYINYTDTSSLTVNTNIYVYNLTSGNQTGITHSTSGSNGFSTTMVINSDTCYEVVLFLNHTVFGFVHDTRIVCHHSTITTGSRFNTLFELNFKHCPFGWSNLFGFFIMLACMFSFGQRNSGVSLLLAGFILLGINVIIGLNVIMVLVPTIFIILGILVQWINQRRELG